MSWKKLFARAVVPVANADRFVAINLPQECAVLCKGGELRTMQTSKRNSRRDTLYPLHRQTVMHDAASVSGQVHGQPPSIAQETCEHVLACRWRQRLLCLKETLPREPFVSHHDWGRIDSLGWAGCARGVAGEWFLDVRDVTGRRTSAAYAGADDMHATHIRCRRQLRICSGSADVGDLCIYRGGIAFFSAAIGRSCMLLSSVGAERAKSSSIVDCSLNRAWYSR